MQQKNTQRIGNFYALRRRCEVIMSLVLSAIIFAGPVEASTWKPTALVNTEAFQAIDDSDSTANVVLKFGDTLAKTLIYNRSATRFEFNDKVFVNGNLTTTGTLSGAQIHAEKNLTSSGSLVWEGTASGNNLTVGGFNAAGSAISVFNKGTGTIARLGAMGQSLGNVLDITSNSFQVTDETDITPGTLYLNPNGGNVGIGTAGGSAKATLDVHGTLSGSSVFAGGSITGAGLTSCSNGTTSKLLWNSATGKFSCGTDQTGGASFGTGNVLTIGNQKYVSKQGDTMTGTLIINMQGGTVNTIGAKIINTLSGAQIHAEKNLTSSGTILSFGNILTKGALITSSFGHTFASGASITELSGFNDMVNIQTGNLGINGVTRLNSNGNLTNIGSIQSGEINATMGGTFATKVDYTTGTIPGGVAVGDINGDGKIDAVTANDQANSISILMNNGNGTFATKVDYAGGGNPTSIAIGDLNGDGKPDLVAGNSTGVSVSVYINKGDGTFAAKVDYTMTDNPNSVAIGDLNGDGKADLAAVSPGATAVSIFINKGNGTFAASVDYTTGSSPHSVAIGDVNGDGKADLAVTNYSSTSVSIFMNKGNGTFAAKVDYTTGTSPYSVAMSDVNGDGKADLAVTNYSSTSVSVLVNNGNGTFATKVDYTTGSGPQSIVMGDVNGDGKADLAVMNYGGGSVSIFMNKGNGTFATKVDYAANATPVGIAMGDVNGDGKADLAVANGDFFTSVISIFLNNTKSILYASAGTGGVVGIGTSTPGSKLSVSGSVLIDTKGNIKNSAAKAGVALEVKGAMSGSTIFASSGLRSSGTVLSFGNILTKGAIITSSFGQTFASGASITELSGFNDMVNIQTGNLGTKGVTRLDSNGNLTNIGSIQSGDINATGGGTFPIRVDYTAGTNTSGVAVGDLNGDGKADIAVANYGSTTVSVFINTGTGTFRAKVDYTTGTNPIAVAIGDVNGDGKPDMAVANNGSTSVSVFLNKGDGTFAAKVDYTTGTNPRFVAIGDVNGDGKADLAITNYGGTSVSVFLNNGNGTFGVKIDYTTGTNPQGVSMGDVNGDGKADLAVTNYGSNNVSIFLNNGNGTFGTKTDYTTATNPTSVAIGDLSGDGKADLAVGNEGSNSISIFINTGAGTFAAKVDYTSGTGGSGGGNSPESMLIADLNGDGKADVAAAGAGNNNVLVYLNKGDGTFPTRTEYGFSISSNPVGIAAGDMNGDGKLDVAAVSNVSTGLSVFLNKAKSVLFASTNTGGVVGIGTNTPGSTLSVSGSVLINRNGSMGNSAAKAGVALEVVGTLSGSSVVGAGLSSCSNGTTSKLLYDSTTGRFSCGTDQTGVAGSTFGSGNVLTIGNQKYVSKQGDTMTGTLIINMQGGNPNTIGAKILNTLSGAILHAEKTLSSSGTLVWEGTGSGKSLTISDTASFSGPLTFGDAIADAITVNAGTWTFANDTNFALSGGVNGLSFDTNTFSVDAANDRIGIGTTAPDTTLEVVGTVSGSVVYGKNSLRSSGSLVVEGTMSGASLYVGGSINGAGLTTCSNGTTSKLLWDSTLGRFTCGTDQAGGIFGTGNVLTIGNQKYVSKQGDTMTGALTINVQGGTVSTVGAKIVNTLSGAILHGEKTVTSSGTLVWEGAASGATLAVSGAATFAGPLTFGDAISDAMTVNAGTWTFANDTNFALSGGVNGLSFDTNTFSVDATNDRIGIGTTAPKTKLEVVGTISGSQIRASNMTVSGAVVYTSGSTLQATAKGSSGQLLISRGTAAPEWKTPTGSMVWFLGGTQTVGATQGAQVFLPFGFQPTSVNMIATGAPTGAALIADIKQNGSTIFSVKPQINAASTTGGGSATFSSTTLNAGTTLTLDITQIGSTFAGSGLTLLLNGNRRY